MFDPGCSVAVDIGITCAAAAYARHHHRAPHPLNIPFQNGPIENKDVFVPLDAIIGGVAQAGHGWRMLIEQLSVGRCVSLPSFATGARSPPPAPMPIRLQFNLPVGNSRSRAGHRAHDGHGVCDERGARHHRGH
jgi:acyl-CoA dehydrogenase